MFSENDFNNSEYALNGAFRVRFCPHGIIELFRELSNIFFK